MLTNVQLRDEGEYTVIASNSFGAVESLRGTLVLLIRPVVTIQPVSQSVVAGGNAVFSVSASGNPFPLSFRWRSNGLPVATFTLHDTNCFFTLTNVQQTAVTNQFRYSVVVTNLAGSSTVSSNAVLTVLADSDGDGMPDEWELANNLNPTDPADAALDSDGDSVANRDEYLAGTDPLDAQSYLKVESITLAGSPQTTLIRFPSRAGKTYSVLRRDSVNGGAWISLADVPAISSNRVVEVLDSMPLAPGQIQRFYRLVTPRLPP
jgi:hypothetical protein